MAPPTYYRGQYKGKYKPSKTYSPKLSPIKNNAKKLGRFTVYNTANKRKLKNVPVGKYGRFAVVVQIPKKYGRFTVFE